MQIMSAVARSADCLESQLRRDNTNQLRSLCVQMIVQPRKACTFVKGLGTQGADRPGVRIDSESHPTRPTLGAAVRLPPHTHYSTLSSPPLRSRLLLVSRCLRTVPLRLRRLPEGVRGRECGKGKQSNRKRFENEVGSVVGARCK